MASAKEIGRKYGQSTNDFATSSKDAVEQVLLDWTNEGIALMAKKIRTKSRTGSASTLAQDMVAVPTITGTEVSVKVLTGQQYEDYIDKGVKGTRKNKAPNSPYKFKNLGTPPKMIQSFKQYIARTGTTKVRNKQLIQKNKKKQDDIITKTAKELAVATKIGGIKPMLYKEEAINPKRIKQLTEDLSVAMGQVLISKITKL